MTLKSALLLPVSLLFVMLLAGCGRKAIEIDQEVARIREAMETPAASRGGETTPTAATPTPIPVSATLPDGRATALMYDLIGEDRDKVEQAMDTIAAARDTRFVAVFLELMRSRQIGLVQGDYSAIIDMLERLSRQELGDNWPAWIEWYGGTELEPPPGFTGWKGSLLGRIDGEFADFLQDEHPARIRVEEIQWGGVAVDGIPPLEQAPMIPAAEASYLLPEEPVFGVQINGEARAYPLRIVDNHEMANDVVGGVPMSLAYCTLCGAAIAFDGRLPNGTTTTFGTSGFLYRSNKLMYDRATRTLWNQLTGEPVLGELAAEPDLRLELFPVVLSAWQDWSSQHPDTLVLDRGTGVYPPEFYEPGVLYGGYFASDETMFPVWQRSDLLEDKAFVYTLYLDGTPKAYEVKALAREQVVNDRVGEIDVVLVATQGTSTVEGTDRRVGYVTYTNGGEVRAYARDGRQFTPGPDPYTILDGEERPWQVTEEALVGPNGEQAPRLGGHLAYWFGWYAFFPETELYSD